MEGKMEKMEMSPLIGKGEINESQPSSKARAIGSVIVIVGVAGLMSTYSTSDNLSNVKNTQLNTEELTFVISNEYGSDIPGDGYYPWKYIAEPYKESTFTVVEPSSFAENLVEGTEVSYHWHTIEDEEHHFAWGQQMAHTFKGIGKQQVHFARYVTDIATQEKTQTHHISEDVQVKYVKREMRSLSDDDRETFFGALETVYKTSDTDGVSKYGANFVSIDNLVKSHLTGAGQLECDHWHDGAGIMVHHLSFTLKLELALQAVNPSVTVPYWEFTIDSVELGDNWRTSKMFSDEWFGNSGDTLDEHHYIKKGRWAYLTISKDPTFATTNAYGLLRSPWNVNPTAYVTRSNQVLGSTYMDGTLPTCSIVKDCFQSSTLAAMNTCLNGATHGPIHILLGGQWGVMMNEVENKLIGSSQLLLFKKLWRAGFSRCPKSQEDIESGFTECSCSENLVEAHGGAYNILSQETDILKSLAMQSDGMIVYDESTDLFTLPGKTQDEEMEVWKSLLSTMCSAGGVGEMYSSAAPYDPTFWVLHTTAERLLQYRRLRAESSIEFPTALAFDETWGYEDIEANSESTSVYDWTSVDEEDELSMPTSKIAECSGHAADDVLPFDLNQISSTLSASTTNIEFYEFLNPKNDDLTYVYDTFKYNKCAEAGYQIGVPLDDADDLPPTDDMASNVPPK